MAYYYNIEIDPKHQFHTNMFNTLYKHLMTPKMIELRKNIMIQRIILYNNQRLENLNLNKQKEQFDYYNDINFIEYMKELEKENFKYCIEKIN